jgi:hypothetical protein
MPRFLLVVLAGLVVMAVVETVAASSAPGPTYMFRGTKNVGNIQPTGTRGGVRSWYTACGADTEVELTRGSSARHRTRINVHWWDGVVVGFSRLATATRWAIYDNRGGTKVVGFAVMRTVWRWDVYSGRRKVGHTVGPDGPVAPTALLINC